jgi:hypothetical protein
LIDSEEAKFLIDFETGGVMYSFLLVVAMPIDLLIWVVVFNGLLD